MMQEAQTTSAAAAAAPGEASSRPPTVLFVDDDRSLLAGLQRQLRGEDFGIRCACSADEAMRIFKNESIDLVVCDQAMPGIDGTGLLQMLRHRYPRTVRFMLTGQATLDVAIKAINDGMVSKFFTKPCDAHVLALSIRQALREQAARGEPAPMPSDPPPDLLGRIEWENPGITRVRRDETGTVILEEVGRRFDEFIDTIRTIGEEEDLDL